LRLWQIIVWFLQTIIYTLVRSPLARFPGPKLWALSRIPSQLSVLRGRTHLDITALHARYGPVVRIGPNELAFNSPEAFRDIYGARPGHGSFAKDRSHYVLPPNGVDHLVSAVDDTVHARHRKLLAYAFSDRSLREQEGLIRGYVDLLIAKLREQCESAGDGRRQGRVDIKSWMNYTTFDITGDLMFGEPFDCLKQSELHPWIGLIFNSIKAISLMGAMNQFPLLNAVLTSMIPKSVIQKGLDHFNLGARKVDRRLELGTERPDFLSAILKNGLSEKEGQYEEDERIMSRAEIHSNAFMYVAVWSFILVSNHPLIATICSG
jgi:cytochrome P450